MDAAEILITQASEERIIELLRALNETRGFRVNPSHGFAGILRRGWVNGLFQQS